MQRYINTFTSSSGRPIVGGEVTIYESPGLTVATIYSDNGLTETANPIVTDENGFFGFYAADGRYSMSLTSPDTQPLMLTDSILLEDPQDGSAINIVGGTISDSELIDVTIDDVAFDGPDIAKYSTLAAPSGSGLVGFQAEGVGATLNTVQAKGRETVSPQDYMTDAQRMNVHLRLGTLDVSDAWSRAKTYIETFPQGGVVKVPDGRYRISQTISNDRSANSALGRVEFVGESQNGVVVVYDGAGDNCFYFANNQNTVGEQNASYQCVSNMTILGPSKRAGSCGIVMNLGAFPKFRDLNIQGFDYAMYLQDVDQAMFEKVNARFNKKGIFGRKAPSPGAASTQPNNWDFIHCSLSNNEEFGGYVIGASCVNYFGGDIEYNGSIGAAGFGFRAEDCGYEGGKGLNVQGTYIEGNNGVADIVLVSTTVNVTPMLSVVHTISADFKRLPGAFLATNNILCQFGADATVGHQQLVLVGCSFKSYSTYTPSAGRPYIAFTGVPANITNFFDHGSYYADALETPAFVQNHNKFDLKFTKAADQIITTSTTTVWGLDTVSSPSTLWTPTLAAGGATIAYAGMYSISAYVQLSATATGKKAILIFKGGSLVGYGEITTANNVVFVTVNHRFAVGEVLSFQFRQESGADQTILAANSYVSVTKII